jgi:hypothetical protein
MAKEKLMHNCNQDGGKCQSSAIDNGANDVSGPVILESRIGDNAPIENRPKTMLVASAFSGTEDMQRITLHGASCRTV